MFVAEVDGDHRFFLEPLVRDHFRTLIPGQRFPSRALAGGYRGTDPSADRCGVVLATEVHE